MILLIMIEINDEYISNLFFEVFSVFTLGLFLTACYNVERSEYVAIPICMFCKEGLTYG